MSNSKKPLAVLSMAAVAGLLATAITTPVSAAASAIAVNGTDAKTYEYNYADLKASATSAIVDGTTSSGAKLYNDFMSRKSGIKAYYDDVQKAYVDFSVVSKAVSDFVVNNPGKTFDFAGFLKTATTETLTPDKVSVGTDGNVVVTPPTPVNVALTVSAVSATNANTLSVTGTGLDKLKATAINVAGNTVTSVVANADGTSATIVLDGKLAPNAETAVTVTDDNGAKDYTVTFGFVVTSVNINEATFDDDRANQQITFKVNGSSADADVDYLTLAGYTVNFVATDKTTGAAANIFVGGTATSATGKLVTGITAGNYNIQLQVTKTGAALASDTATISVANLDNVAASIDSVQFANFGADLTDGTTYDDNNATTDELTADDFIMNSTTLVAGEKVKPYSVKTIVGGEKKLAALGSFEVTTSNPAVVSVAESSGTYTLTAEAAGTATITVKSGTVTKAYTFTVQNKKRELTAVKFDQSTLNVVKGKTGTVKATVVDQFGDPYAAATGDIDEVIPTVSSNPLVTAANVDVVTTTASSVGKVTLSAVDGLNKGTGTIYFKDKTTNPNTGLVSNKTIGSLNINVTDVDNVSTRKIELVNVTGQSTDNTLELTDDNAVSFRYANYNSNGIYVDNAVVKTASPAAGEYIVSSLDTGVATVAVASNIITVTGVAKGSTDIIIKDSTGNLVAKTTVTVTNNQYKITGVSFKSVPKIDYVGKSVLAKDVLDITESNNDDIVNGVTLSRTSQSKVRIAEAAGAAGTGIAVDDLYLDVDNNGTATAGDIKLGTLVAGKTSDSTFTVTAAGTGTGYANNNMLSAATASTDKGTLIVKVMTNASDATTSVSATSIAIDVK